MINAKFKKLKDSIFIYTSAEVLADLKDMYEVLNLLQAIILKFNENYKNSTEETILLNNSFLLGDLLAKIIIIYS